MASVPAFAPCSSFTPTLHPRSCVLSSRVRRAPRMVASENVSRKEEIKRLQKQLEELRAARDRIAGEGSPSAPQAANPPPQAPSEPAIEDSVRVNGAALPFEIGKHGAGSRFLSLPTVAGDEYFPRVLTIAGRIPDLTVEQFESTPSALQNRAPDEGNMFVTMLPPEYKGQIIAMPGMEVISKCRDPVVVLIAAEDLSEAQLPIEEGDDLALLVERNTEGQEFDKTKFYAWAVGGDVKVGWAKDLPSPQVARCIGRVIFGMLQVKQDMRQRKSCWEEENEAYSV